MTGSTEPKTNDDCLLWTQLITRYSKKEYGLFDISSERNPLTSLILHSSSHPLVPLPAKARALINVFGDAKAVLALAAIWPCPDDDPS